MGPIFVSYFFGIKSLATVYPDMALGGILWFVDLSVPDPNYVLPFIAGGSFLLILEIALSTHPSSSIS